MSASTAALGAHSAERRRARAIPPRPGSRTNQAVPCACCGSGDGLPAALKVFPGAAWYSHAWIYGGEVTTGRGRPVRLRPARGRRAHNGCVGRIIGTILGAILAVWLAVTVGGGIFATLKAFLIIGLIAMAVFIVVWLVARRPRRG